jgi:hypothetical protein
MQALRLLLQPIQLRGRISPAQAGIASLKPFDRECASDEDPQRLVEDRAQ